MHFSSRQETQRPSLPLPETKNAPDRLRRVRFFSARFSRRDPVPDQASVLPRRKRTMPEKSVPPSPELQNML